MVRRRLVLRLVRFSNQWNPARHEQLGQLLFVVLRAPGTENISFVLDNDLCLLRHCVASCAPLRILAILERFSANMVLVTPLELAFRIWERCAPIGAFVVALDRGTVLFHLAGGHPTC